MKITAEPKLPKSKRSLPPAFQQTLSLDVGSLTWCALGGQRGVYQLLHAEVAEGNRRSGYGSALLDAACSQIARHANVIEEPARRLVVLVRQPEVIVRAWLQRGGFVHVHTLEDVDREDDVMVLQRTFD